MKSEKQMIEQEQTTEEKILEAASVKSLYRKGFAGTRTRDIAEKRNKSSTTQLLFPK